MEWENLICTIVKFDKEHQRFSAALDDYNRAGTTCVETVDHRHFVISTNGSS